MPDVAHLATDERTDLLELLRGLDLAQWNAPTLCPDWSVREVVGHVLSYEDLTLPSLAGTFVRGGLRTARVNEVALRPFRDLMPAELLDRLAAHLRPRGLTAMMGGAVALTDGLIHHQDIRRGLDLPRAVPTDRLRAALEVAAGAPTLPSRGNRRGLRLVAVDLDWTLGGGPEVRGPGEAVLMAMAGRSAALPELEGEGVATLAGRLGA